ncbi:MAG: hypothetical protein KIT48_12140 [Pseudolabrys sp.]|nr:hypothetical protein [Pseudolabrys sp.]
MTKHRCAPREHDPDAFDIVVQSLSLLSSVATLATAWQAFIRLPNRSRSDDDHGRNATRKEVRTLIRWLEDAFDSVDQIIRVFERVQTDLLDTPPRFGTSVLLNQQDFQNVMNYLMTLNNATQQARQTAISLQNSLSFRGIANEGDINFDAISTLNADLNDILFNTSTIREAVTKLRAARNKAERFVDDVDKLLRGN